MRWRDNGEPLKFPTFYHISEYGLEAYEGLPTLIATSRPLNLWAPSSVMLRAAADSVSPTDFVHYVERGDIRIIGRHQWLTDREFRQKYHPWEGARWDDYIDGELLRICNEDASLDESRRRVIVAPPESGWEWADEFLQRHPEQMRVWSELIRDERNKNKLPPGTWETVERKIEEGNGRIEAGVRTVLRDVYNHGQAYGFSGADVPFNRPEHERFMKLLAAVKVGGPAKHRPTRVEREQAHEDFNLAAATAELVDVLGYLAAERHADLRRFMERSEHDALIRWVRAYCHNMKDRPPKAVDGEALSQVEEVLKEGSFRIGLGKLLEKPVSTSVAGVGLAVGALALANQTDPLGLIGLGTGVFPAAAWLIQLIGWIPADYDGQQWPYLYLFDKKASKRRRQILLNLMKEYDSISTQRPALKTD